MRGKLKDINIPQLAKLAREGYAILSAVPSCTLMYKQELPLMFPAMRTLLWWRKRYGTLSST